MNKLIILTVLLLSSISAKAQSEITIEEPEFSGQVVYVKTPSEGILLPKENAQIKTKIGASVFIVGVGSVKSRIHLQGKSAETRVSHNPQTKFIVRAVDNKTDPLQIINVIKFEEKKNERRAEVESASTFGGTASNNMVRLEFNAKKFGVDSYLISIDNIQPGEYGIYVTNPNEKDEKNTLIIATFGVD